MPNIPKTPERKKAVCHYTSFRETAVREKQMIESLFLCPGCGAQIPEGLIYFCDYCQVELGPCCHPLLSKRHRHASHEIPAHEINDYIPPKQCLKEGKVRCMCCRRLLCLEHARKADIARLSLPKDYSYPDEIWKQIILCPECKETLDPNPEPEWMEDANNHVDESAFEDSAELRSFLRSIPYGYY